MGTFGRGWRYRIGRIRPLLAGIIAAAGTLISTPVASAQWFSPWSIMEESNNPGLNARQLKQYAEMLSLSPDQRSAADDLLGSYEREHRAIAKRMQEISKSIETEYDNDDEIDVWREVWPKVIKSFMKKTEKLEKSLMDDLKSLLDASQQSKWAAVERLHRRQTTMRYGHRNGEQIDLVDLVDGLRLDRGSSPGIAAILDQYAIELDRELAARNTYIETNLDRFFEVWTNWDQEKMTALYKDYNGYSKKIVDLNQSYGRQIQAALPPEKQAEFDLKIKLASYPRVYKKSYTIRVFEAVDKLTDLDTGQREGIKGLRETYDREAGGANDKWSAALAEQENKQQDTAGMFGWWGGEEDPKIIEARKQRKEIDKKTVDSIRALLTEDQRKKLPDRKWKPEFDLDAPTPSTSK